MRRIILVVIILLIGVMSFCFFIRFKSEKEPKGLTSKFIFGKEGKGLGEFIYPFSLAIKENYLFVADSGNSRIQVLKIDPDGRLSPKFSFGKEGKGLGEFGRYPIALFIKDSYLYITDTENNCIQILEIKY